MRTRQIVVALVLGLFSWAPLLAQPQTDTPKQLLLTEVATESVSSASAEFIELYNPNDFEVELENFKLQYLTASAEDCQDGWITKYDFESDDVAARRGFFLLSTEERGLEEFSAEFNAGLSASGGHLRLVKSVELAEEDTETEDKEQSDPDDSSTGNDDSTHPCETEGEFIHDFVSWGDASHPEGDQPAEAAEDDESIKRRVDEDGRFVDVSNNYEDWLVSAEPQPQMTPVEPPTDNEEDEPDNTEDGDSTDNEDEEGNETDEGGEDNSDNDEVDGGKGGSSKKSYATVVISELFIDPAMPLTDANDEFVELYNPHHEPVDLSGYTIQAGSQLQYSDEVDDITLKPGEYRAFKSEATGLKLANSGGRAQVLNPNGDVAAQLVRYPGSETGESYSLLGGKYKWTDNVTPNTANKPHSTETDSNKQSSNSSSTADTNEKTYANVLLNEFVPDPESPQKDSEDEFVELYNPNNFAVDLTDYVIRSGSRGTTKHTIGNVTIQPGQYVVFFSSDSSLTLSNSGITIELEDPNGTVLDSQTYPEAKEGQAWARTEGGDWQWTATLTPAAKNTFTSAGEEAGSANATPADGDSEASVLGSASTPATVDAKQADYQIIVGAAILALLYGVYEFRYDAYAYLHKLRQYFSNR